MAIFTTIGAALFGAGTFLAGLTAAGLQIAAGIAVNFIAASISGQKAKESPFAVQGQIQMAGNVGRSFILGRGATAGSLAYSNSWGNEGDTPNAYFTQVIALSDLPVSGLAQVWVNGSLCTVDTLATPAEMGSPVVEFRTADGKDHLWVKFYDGTQTAADGFLVSRVGTAERPYGADRVGYGVAYVVMTALINRDLFQGFPQYKFALHGMKLYDPSRDSSVGGVGTQRVSNPATWGGDGDAFPAVQIYNVLRGLTYNGKWFYGLQNLPAARLPAESWIEAINKCRNQVQGPAGPEARYRSGGEIRIDAPIADTLEALLAACHGRIAEVGGAYKLQVGSVGLPTSAITDATIISTSEQSFTPFFGLAETTNGISAKYPAPLEGWALKEAPPQYRPVWEIADGNRRLMADVTLDLVPFNAQVQRLMKMALSEGRRARRHTLTLPPEFWLLEPGDVVSWTSGRNGYTTKQFRVDGVADQPSLDVIVDFTEVDPSDYTDDSYSSGDETLVIPQPVAPQPVNGFYVEATLITGANGTKRAAIDVHWDGTQPDVRTIMIRIRRDDGDIPVFQGRPVDFAAGVARIGDGLLPLTGYEVQVEYEPFSARPTELSGWLPVTTLDARLSAFDLYEGVIGFPYLGQDMQNYIDWMSQTRSVIDTMSRSILRTIDQDADQYSQIEETRRELSLSADRLTAYFQESIIVAVGPESALAQQLVELGVEMEGKASASALTALQSTVTEIDGQVEANTFALTQIGAQIDDAVATASQGLQTQITENEEGLSAIADDVTDLFVAMAGGSAGVKVRYTTYATPSGFSARIGLEASATNGGTFRSAGIFIDVPSSGPTRVAIDANQFVIMNGVAGAVSPFIVQGGVVYMDTARIRDLTVDTIKIANGAISSFVQSDQSGNISVSDGSGTFWAGGTISVPSGISNQGVSIDVNAVYIKVPSTTTDPNGSFRIQILRAGSHVEYSPPIPMTALDAGCAHFMYFDANPPAGNQYYTARGVIYSNGGSLSTYNIIRGASIRLAFAKR